jgi:hypothetical protein
VCMCVCVCVWVGACVWCVWGGGQWRDCERGDSDTVRNAAVGCHGARRWTMRVRVVYLCVSPGSQGVLLAESDWRLLFARVDPDRTGTVAQGRVLDVLGLAYTGGIAPDTQHAPPKPGSFEVWVCPGWRLQPQAHTFRCGHGLCWLQCVGGGWAGHPLPCDPTPTHCIRFPGSRRLWGRCMVMVALPRRSGAPKHGAAQCSRKPSAVPRKRS